MRNIVFSLYNKLLTFLLIVPTVATAQSINDTKDLAGWHKQYSSERQGANIEAAMKLLRDSGRKPSGKIVVGVVDSGLDTAVVSLQHVLWTNAGERPDSRDNDGNGYADDLHGWNFLGTGDGSFNMTSAGTEEFRQFKRLFPKYKNVKQRSEVADTTEYDFYMKMRKKAGIDRYLSYYQLALQSKDSLDSLSLVRLAEMERNIYGIEHDQDKRLLMGDNMEDANDRYYGNPTITIDGCQHGTFVAGIIGGQTASDIRYNGVAEGIAEVMAVRVSPDGDEYDKDVATGIRYAVDNGAKVINVSLGKYYSPRADMVNDAIRYALDHDVLVVHAAGNDAKNIDDSQVYPSGLDPQGVLYPNFLRVAASNEKGGRASFSNYSSHQVHLFAPGTYISSVFPNNKYSLSQGTSFAAPVVSGIAALLRSYFPSLKATDIVRILCQTVRPMEGEQLSISGGLVDMEAAVRQLLSGVDWHQVEAVSEKKVSDKVYELIPSPSWIDGSCYALYSTKSSKGSDYYLVDGRNGRTEPLLRSTEKFLSQYVALTGDTLKRDQLRFYNLEILKNDASRFYWRSGKNRLVYDRKKGRLLRDTRPEKETKRGRGFQFRSRNDAHTADSAFTMLGDRFNLYVRNNRSGQTRQLTTDGREYASYCKGSARDTLREGSANGFWKGHIYFCPVYDDSKVEFLNVVHHQDTPPRLVQKKMPLPNTDGIRRYRLYWYNADTGEGRLLPLAPNTDYNIQFNYDEEADHQYFLRRSRSVDTLELCRIDAATGQIRTVISEVCHPHLNVNMFKYHVINHGREILWWSERTGRGNYYLYDNQGRLKNRITQGDNLVAGRIEKIDTLHRTILFLGYGQEPDTDPSYTFYYKASLDGRRQQLLTPGNGEHQLQQSRDGHWAIDRYSRMDMPPVFCTVNLDNPRQHHEFFRVSPQKAMAAGWVKPTLVKVKAADEQTDLYGVMYLPSDTTRFNGQQLPIISNVYPGPQDDQIPRAFAIDDNGNQSLAELGFVVINVQPRGSSPLRGRDFYCYGYGNLRDYPLADDRHTIETLAARYPFIDLSRVGIYGHSGGGFETVAAMLQSPDFYKVGVAASGNHDNNIYIQWWAETYQGYGKHIPTNMELASRLKGRLLLMTGEVDDNVPIASTIRMADALQKAGKRFDMMLFPGKDHGLYGDYYQNIIRYYFLEHLMHPDKHTDIDIINHN